ncbi:endonuclease domain-containing protein [Roseibium sp. Sym1]|uniref:endonuclease domain-containing protein n=1 Tax=Roseibium sp. Sym1 TaxID=3016006 RepID=UPI002FBD556D
MRHRRAFDTCLVQEAVFVSETFIARDLRNEVREAPLVPVSPLAGEMSASTDRGGYTASVERAEFERLNRVRQMPHREISKRLRANARTLRSGMMDAEKVLWRALRAHRLEGILFRRQMPICGYIVDFAAPAHRLIIELDGSQHGDRRGLQQDRERDRVLRSHDWTVLRFWNSDVMTNLDGVCRKILETGGKEQF